MKKICFFVFIFSSLVFQAVGQVDKIKLANNLYAQGNYLMAAKQYEDVLKTSGVATELYYNAGNSYFKAKEVGRSILNYERALRLFPSYDDARYNLELAQLKVVDNVVPAPTFFVVRWVELLIKFLTSNQWLYISIVFFVLCLLASFLFVFGNARALRKLSFYVSFVFFVVSVLTLVFSGVRNDQIMNHDEAIVMSGVITAKSSPDESGTDLFQLHEGTKVLIKTNLGKWTEIKIGNGSVGWVKHLHLEEI